MNLELAARDIKTIGDNECISNHCDLSDYRVKLRDSV